MNKEGTDLQLAQRIVDDMACNDFSSFERFYRAYDPVLIAYVRRRTDSDTIAEEIVAEFWCQLVDKKLLSKFTAKGECSLKSYLFTILKNKISDYFRKKDNQYKNFTSIAVDEDDNDDLDTLGWDQSMFHYDTPDDNWEESDRPDQIIYREIHDKRREMLQQFINNLPQPKRSIINLALSGKKSEDISYMLEADLDVKISPEAVRQQISRIKKQLVIAAQRHCQWEEQKI